MAMQANSLQDTAANFPPVAPAGKEGAGKRDHSLPFQPCATGLEFASPTATQAVTGEVMQETPSIAFWALPSAGLGADCSDQVEPFQRSTRVL